MLHPSRRIQIERAPLPVYMTPPPAPQLSEVLKTIEGLNEAVAALHTANDEKIAEVKKGFDDVVKTEHVERINASVGELQGTVDEMTKTLARLKLGGSGDPDNPDRLAHAHAFNRWFRKGVEGDLRDLEIKARTSTQSDPDSGYFVTEEMEQTIDRVLGVISGIRAAATVRTIGAQTYKKLVNQGGASGGWAGENDVPSETNTPTLVKLEYPAMELWAMPAATQTSLDDADFNIEAWLADEVSIKFAEDEGAAFATGTGVAQPRGLLSYTTIANASYAWGKVGFTVSGAAAGFAASDPSDAFIDLVHSLKSGYRQGASWMMNDLTLGEVRKFKDGQGNYIWQPSLQAGMPSLILGYPVTTDDNFPDVAANALSVAFADFRRAYLIVDRIGIRVLRDPYVSKPNILFYTTKRVGGGIQNFEAIKLLKISA